MKTEKLRRWFFRTDKHANNNVNNKVLVDCTNYQSCANVPSAIYQTKKNEMYLHKCIKQQKVSCTKTKLVPSSFCYLLSWLEHAVRRAFNGGSSATKINANMRDDNGYLKPETRWVFTPLGYGFEHKILSVGFMGTGLFLQYPNL